MSRATVQDANQNREEHIASILTQIDDDLAAIQVLQERVSKALDEVHALRTETAESKSRARRLAECSSKVYPLDSWSSFRDANSTVTMNNGHIVRLDDIL